ncbi:imelysin family protein, partial [Tritonibacter sp. SIMBA_163]|uniref:imelysin family protein n=1 Tax=Tritonibacter sp. SIMBA_163 TaxID=3080868 RepID=UPI00397F8286
RPNRAEVRRSGRSLRHLELQIDSLRQLALLLSDGAAELSQHLTQVFDTADRPAANPADDPSFAEVSDPQRRFLPAAL